MEAAAKPNRGDSSLPTMVSANDCSLGKWHKRRLSSSATVSLPNTLKAAVEAGIAEFQTQLTTLPNASQDGPSASTVIQTVVDALQKLLDGTTPEYHLRAVSQITGAVMEWFAALHTRIDSGAVQNESESAAEKANSRKRALPAELLSDEVKAFNLILAKRFVFPFMLDCRVRYTHRPLVSLFRLLCESDARLVDVFRDAFLDTNLRCWSSNPSLAKCVVQHSGSGASSASTLRHAVTFIPEAKNEVMHLVNCLDALMMTVMPLVRSAFADTFLDILPFLGGALQWAVDNVHAHQVPRGTQSTAVEPSNSVEESSVEMGGVFGEDLECVRFCVRVVATYSHKFLDRATSVLESIEHEDKGVAVDAAVNCVASLLRPAVTMLSSNLFPKDVLNAAGLLVASVLTVRRLDGVLIYRVCKMCSLRCDQECGVQHAPTCPSSTPSTSLPRMDAVVNVTKILCQPEADSTDCLKIKEELPVLASVFEQFTSNGCFAFFKGLLALFSSRIRNMPSSIGLLLQNISTETQSREAVCALYSIIVPAALRYSAMVQEPNTRFMAIQTVDAVIRHISCVMDAVAVTLEQAAEPSPSHAAVSAALEFTEGNQLPVFCLPTKELRDTVREAVQLVMGMWDDATQQVSGPLHETYHHILHVNEAMKRCSRAFVRFCDSQGSGCAASASLKSSDVAASVLDSKQALVTALKISDARRGKYHALEALQRVISLEEFVCILDEYFASPTGTSAESDENESGPTSASPFGIVGITGFVQMLLGASNNPKVNTTAGDVFSRFLASVVQLDKGYRSSTNASNANEVASTSAPHQNNTNANSNNNNKGSDAETNSQLRTSGMGALASVWLHQCIVTPLCGAILIPGAITVPSNVSVPQSIGNLVAHMVMPWIREHNEVMHEVLGKLVSFKQTLTEMGPASLTSDASLSISEARASHGLVEVLYRARHVGADVNAYLVPTSVAFPLVARALQSAIGTLSSTALNLCTLSAKKTEQVAPWQCAVVETYYSLNMHQGEDSTTRKYLVETFRKWVKRLADSIARPLSGSFATKKPADEARKAKKGAQKKDKADNKGIEAKPEEPLAAANSVEGASASAEVAEQLAYVEGVFRHCLRLVDVFVPHIGINVSAANQLSSERRIAAISCYETLLRTFLPLIIWAPASGLPGVIARAIGNHSGEDPTVSLPQVTPQLMPLVEEVGCALFPETLVPVLLDTLSNSWDKMRAAAQQVLLLYCEFAPHFTAPTFDASEELLAQAKSQLNSRTFRLSEGAVYSYIIAVMGTPTGVVLTSLSAKCHVDTELLASWCEEHVCERANTIIRDTQTMRKQGALYICQEIQKNPLHGVASLCGSLYSIAVGLHLIAEKTTKPSTSPAPRTATRHTADLLLQMSCSVIQVCSLLVGGDAALSNGGSAEGEQDDTLAALVDCRGHVFRQPGAESTGEAGSAAHRDAAEESESSMRVVVNNTWLGIRMATRVIETVVQQTTIEELSLDGVRHTCFTLLDALLRTKHNGVMSTVRAALKTLSMALIRSRSRSFYDIPCELVKLLLGQHGVTSPDMGRVLRRSQGLPHALVAVLEAEDPAVPAYLFPLAVKSLLRIAQGGLPDSVESDGVKKPRTEELIRGHRVNALNVLKFIFDDKLFSGHSIAFIQEAFSLATEGYSAGSWAIRNSSLMLFASVLHRFVGEHPSKGGTNVNTTLYDIAIRTPRGVSFAHSELQKVLLSPSTADQQQHNSDQELGLFPILQMLSMLCPNPSHLISNVINGHDDDLQLVCEAVCACRSVSSLMVRSASATAFAAIAPLERISDTLQHMSTLLLPTGAQETIPHVSFDETHGMLLQVQQFYTAYVGTLRRDIKSRGPNASVTAVQTARIHAEVMELITRTHATLCERSLTCPMITSAYFSLLADVFFFHHSQQNTAADDAHTNSSNGGIEEESAVLSSVVLSVAKCANTIITRPPLQNYYAGRAEHAQAISNISLFLTIALHHAASSDATRSTAAEIIESISSTLGHAVVDLDERNVSMNHARAPANAVLTTMKHMCAYVHEAKGVLSESDVISMHSLLQRTELGSRVSFTDVALNVVESMLNGLQTPGIAPLTARNYFELTACLQWISTFAHAATFESGCRLLPLIRSTLSKYAVNAESSEKSSAQPQPQPQPQQSILSTAVRSAQERLLVPYSDARSWALRCLSRCAAHNPESTPLWAELLETATRFASPEQCVEDRLAVTEVLRIVLPSLRAECHRVFASFSDVSAAAAVVQLFVRYLLLLLRTLFDDACDVRHTACDVATQVLSSLHENRGEEGEGEGEGEQKGENVSSSVIQSQSKVLAGQSSNTRSTLTFGHSTCCVGLVRYIRAWMRKSACELRKRGSPTTTHVEWETDVAEYFYSNQSAAVEEDETTGAGAGEDDNNNDDSSVDNDNDNDDDGEMMEQLFEKESDNMYAEDAMMGFISSILLSPIMSIPTTSTDSSSSSSAQGQKRILTPHLSGFDVLRSIYIGSNDTDGGISQQFTTDVTQLYNYGH